MCPRRSWTIWRARPIVDCCRSRTRISPCARWRRRVAARFRRTACPDERIVFDFMQFRNEADGGGQHSVNAGLARFDTTLLRPLQLMLIRQFCLWVGVLRCAGPTAAAKSDFVAMYRQIRKPTMEWWFQWLFATHEGFRLDTVQSFGDGSGPDTCHVFEDVFVNLVRDEFSQAVQQILDG